MPLKSLIKLYCIPTLIVFGGIFLYYFVFISMKDKTLTKHNTLAKSQITPQDTQATNTTGSAPKVADKDTDNLVPKTQETQNTPPTDIHTKHFISITAKSVNVRSQPNKQSPIITKVYIGQKYELTANLGKWFEITLPEHSQKGYIASYLATQEPLRQENTSQQTNIYKVIVRKANIRFRADQNSAVIGSLFAGENIQVISSDGIWAEVLLQDGRKGYIASRLLEAL